MNLAPSVLQNELAATARDWLRRQLPLSRVRTAADRPGPWPDDSTWAELTELGWLGLGLPVERGGLGFGAAEQAMLFREIGRACAPGPLLSSVLGAHAALRAGADELASEIVSGRRVGMVVGGRLVDGAAGDLAVSIDADGAELLDIVELEPASSVDPLVRVAHVVRSAPVLRADDPLLPARGHVLAAAQLLGIIEAVRDMSVRYASSRTQFGRPIGSFQAVKHRCADMAVAAYASVAQINQAALYVDAARPSASFHAAAAYLVAVRGAARSTADNIQNHGGIGFTWEHDAHLYLKRAAVLANVFGPLAVTTHPAVMAPQRHEFE